MFSSDSNTRIRIPKMRDLLRDRGIEAQWLIKGLEERRKTVKTRGLFVQNHSFFNLTTVVL